MWSARRSEAIEDLEVLFEETLGLAMEVPLNTSNPNAVAGRERTDDMLNAMYQRIMELFDGHFEAYPEEEEALCSRIRNRLLMTRSSARRRLQAAGLPAQPMVLDV